MENKILEQIKKSETAMLDTLAQIVISIQAMMLWRGLMRLLIS